MEQETSQHLKKAQELGKEITDRVYQLRCELAEFYTSRGLKDDSNAIMKEFSISDLLKETDFLTKVRE